MADDLIGASVALHRFGLGAGPGDIERVASDPRGWLRAQIRQGGAPTYEGDTTLEGVAAFQAFLGAGRQPGRRARGQASIEVPSQAADGVDPAEEARRAARAAARREVKTATDDAFLARAVHAIRTPDGFAERWALFWTNQLAVSGTTFGVQPLLSGYENEAIRPNVFGPFETLLLAAEQHPAMLLYLDQARSVGPNSRSGLRRRSGLNENLAREMLELHSVGSDSGYSQGDVTELARALTGWSTPRRPNDPPGQDGFLYRVDQHEPGVRQILGRSYPQEGQAQGEAVVRDLARHPATARRFSARLAAHFTQDRPNPALTARLERAWTGSDGRLDRVALALIEAPEAWTPAPAKVKSPYELLVSAARALDAPPRRLGPLRREMVAMGQPPYTPPSPEGWPDTGADWAGADNMVKRLNWAAAVAARSNVRDPAELSRAVLGPRLFERSYAYIARAESREEAMTLFLMSPEFQRR